MILRLNQFINETSSFSVTTKEVGNQVSKNAENVKEGMIKSISLADKFFDVEEGIDEFKKWASNDFVIKNFKNMESGVRGKEAATEVMDKIIGIAKKVVENRSTFSKVAGKILTDSMVSDAIKSTNWDYLISNINRVTNFAEFMYHMTDDEVLRDKVSKWDNDFWNQLEGVELKKLKKSIGELALTIT